MKLTIMDVKTKLSALWVLVMFNMVFADIYTLFMLLSEGHALDLPSNVRTIMLIAVFATNIPIVMIFLSLALRHNLNRWANVSAGFLTIIYVVGGGEAVPHYIAAAAIEVAILGYIIWTAWRWGKGDQTAVSATD